MKKFLENFPSHFSAFIESLNPHSKSLLSPNFPQKASLNEMAPTRKSSSYAATAITSKGKFIDIGDYKLIDAHLPHLEVHIEDVREDTLSRLLCRRKGLTGRKPS